ncbi:MAG: protein-L-isoaspartate O-methyltransferase [Candidatus Thermoplasmatota archaeon]
MSTNKREELVEKLVRYGYIKSDKVKEAMLSVPRELFVPYNRRSCAYIDTPLEIGEGQTISAPHMIAIMCEVLDITKGEHILEIGTGSGYHAAIVSKMVGPRGKVYTIERIHSLADKAKVNLKNAGIKNVEVHVGDGSLGLSEHAPYDKIYVTCAAPVVPPPLIEQLKDGGKLLVPLGSSICSLKLLEKKKDKTTVTDHGGCVFVPLIGVYGH